MSDRLPEWATVALSSGLTHSRYARHIRIEQPSHSIKGRYTIGPAAQDHRPPLYDPPLEQVAAQTSSSASFETKGSAISAEVWIMGDHDLQQDPQQQASPATHRRKSSLDHSNRGERIAKDGNSSRRNNQPVSVAAKSYMGRIHLSIPQYTPSRPLHLRAKSHSGSIHICLPPTFSGLVSWRTESGILKLSPAIKARYTGLGEAFKHRGVGIVVAKTEARPAGHVVGQIKAVVEKEGLQPRFTREKSSKARPTSSGGSTSVAPARATLHSNHSSTSVSRELSNDGSATLVSGRTSPNPSTAPSSPSLSPSRSFAALRDNYAGGPQLGLPAHAVASSATASGTATRGDACELITAYGNIHLYEVGEKTSMGNSASEACYIM